MRTSLAIKAVLAVAAAGLPLLCNAESTTVNGAGALSTTAHVDFQITIPKFLSLQIGTAGVKIDQITWAPTAAQVGTGSLAGTGGDQTNGTETASVIANAGTVTFSSATVSALTDTTADTISYSQIAVATAARTSATVLPSPALVDAGTTTITLAPILKVVAQDALWTYSYKNTLTPAAGTYGGVNTNGSRVTYTASVP
jgi:hypothetical protein